MNECYVVIGMHRSGTSLVSGLLHNSGIDMGIGYFKPPGKDNPRGYYEDQRFRRMNDRMLKFSRYDVKSWDVRIPTIRGNKTHQGQIWGIVAQNSSKTRWGFKDPRTCLTWHMWRQHLPQNTQVVYVYRNPMSVANSLLKRGNIDNLDQGLLLWNLYNERALPIRKHYDTVFIEYESVLSSHTIAPLGIRDTKNLIDTTLFHNKGAEIPESCRVIWETLKNSE